MTEFTMVTVKQQGSHGCFERFQGADGRQRIHHGDFDAEAFASEQLWPDKEVTIEAAVGPFSCLLRPISVLRFWISEGLTSSRISIIRGGILMSIGNFLEILSQAILAGIILVWRLGVVGLFCAVHA